MLEKSEIEKVISEKIYSLAGKKIHAPGEELIDSGTLTSITMAELAVELEKIFSVHFSFMEVRKENFSSVESIAKLIRKKSD